MPVFVCECHPLDNLLDFCLLFRRLRCPSTWEVLSGISSFSSSSASDTGNSKLEESTRLMCSTGLLMHDLIIDFYKWLCRYWRRIKEGFFGVFFCITIFPEEAQNKNKVGIKTTFLLMMKILKAKGPTQARLRLGRDEGIFWKAVNNKRNYLNRWVVEGT